MMSIRFASGPEDEVLAERFAASHPLGSFMQSPRWALVKPKWGHTVLFSQREDGTLRGSMLVLSLADRGDGKALLYAPRGPVCDFHDLHALATFLPGRGCWRPALAGESSNATRWWLRGTRRLWPV